MRLKVKEVGPGLHHSEAVVLIETRGGFEELIIDPRSLEDARLEVGWPVGRDGEYYLVELPRPTARGGSRVWVKGGSLMEDEPLRVRA